MSTAAFTNYTGGTFVADLVKRPEFLQYLQQDIYAQSQFIQSGVVARDARLDARAGGTRIEIPYFSPIAPTEETITSSATWGTSTAGYLTPQTVTGSSMVSSILHRGMAFAVDDLSKLATGSDPGAAIMGYLSKALNVKRTATLVNQLTGIFGSALAANVTDVSAGTGGAQYISAASVTAAKVPLGERSMALTAIAVHPNVYHYLQQIGQLTFSSSSLTAGGSITWGGGGVGVTSAQIAYFGGLRVIVDSLLPTSSTGATTVYTSYLFGDGVISEGNQQDLRIATDRNILSMQDVMAVDYHYTQSLIGVSWNSATDNPTTAQLATTGNWTLKYDAKLLPIAALKTMNPFN